MGRGPSSAFHIGHLIVLKEARDYAIKNNLKILFQFSDDEKLFRDKEEVILYNQRIKNDSRLLKNYFGERIFIFSNIQSPTLYSHLFNKQPLKKIKLNYLLPLFNMGKDTDALLLTYSYFQALLPVYLKTIGIEEIEIFSGEDQKSYFQLSKKLDSSLKLTFLEVETLIDTTGKEKMTSSSKETALFINDSKEQITRKIIKSSSGAISSKNHEKEGLDDPSKDFPYILMKRINSFSTNEYLTGQISSLEFKKKTISEVSSFISTFQLQKEEVDTEYTEENFLKWMRK